MFQLVSEHDKVFQISIGTGHFQFWTSGTSALGSCGNLPQAKSAPWMLQAANSRDTKSASKRNAGSYICISQGLQFQTSDQAETKHRCFIITL